MNQLFGMAVTVMLCAALFGCGSPARPAAEAGQTPPAAEEQPGADLKAEEDAVLRLVEAFGNNLRKVSLLAPADVLRQNLQEVYGEFVTPELLAEWQADPVAAPGRTVSSPWPDRIEVKSLERQPDGSYRVQGEIVEVASAEQAENAAVAKFSITLEVKPDKNRWLISKYSGIRSAGNG